MSADHDTPETLSAGETLPVEIPVESPAAPVPVADDPTRPVTLSEADAARLATMQRRYGADFQFGQMPGGSPQGLIELLKKRDAEKAARAVHKPAWGTKERPANVCICMPIYDMLEPETYRCKRHILKPLPREGGYPLYGRTGFAETQGVTIEEARNQMATDAMSEKHQVLYTHVLWIDADMVFHPDALQRLLAHDLPIVGGLCFNRRGPSYRPVLMRRHHPAWATKGNQMGFVYHYRPNTLEEVDATGAAFLLVQREVFERMKVKIDQDEPGMQWFSKRRGISEDFSFCERAQELGYKIYVDTSVKIGHIGKVVIDETFAAQIRTVEDNPWMSAPQIADGQPRAQITIPTYNQSPDLLKAAVLSVLAQTVPCEVVVVDDGSTDPPVGPDFEAWLTEVGHGHAKILRHEKRVDLDAVRELMARPIPGGGTLSYEQALRKVQAPDSAYARSLIDQAWTSPTPVSTVMVPWNRGIATALNTGVRDLVARHQAKDPSAPEWWGWLSSDDMYLPAKIAHQIDVTRQMRAKCSFTRWQSLGPNTDDFAALSHPYSWSTIKEQMQYLSQACVVNGSTVLIHHSVFPEIGYFDEEIKYGQDWDFWCRVGICHFWAPVPDVLVTRREFGNLTARIEQDEALRKVRDREDERIRSQYAAYLPEHLKSRI